LIGKQGVSEVEVSAGAQAFYEQNYNNVARRAGLPVMGDGPIDTDIQAAMASDMIAQLVEINGGNALSAEAEQQINQLMAMGPEGFAGAIVSDRASVAAQNAANRALLAGDPEARVSAMTGIMAILLTANAAEVSPNFGGRSHDDVDLSPAAQTRGQENGAFRSAHYYLSAGDGNSGLARLLGVPHGELSENRSDGPQSDSERQAFLIQGVHGQNSYTTGDVHSEAHFGEPTEVGGVSGTPRDLVIAGFEAQGFEFASAEAEQAMLVQMVALVEDNVGANDFADQMRDFVEARSDITMSSEREIEAPSVTVTTADPVIAEAIEVAQVADPRSAYAVELYGADPGIAPMVSATPEATAARLSSVPEFMADMAAQRDMQAVPAYSPLAAIDPNRVDLMEPQVGPRISQ